MFKSKIMVLKKNAPAQHIEPKFYDFLPEDFYQINKDQLMYMWHFLSDKDIAELYDIPARKVKNRRHDFNIKPVTSAIDRIERELYGREDWLEEELKSVLPFEYNNGNNPHTNSTPLNSEKEFFTREAWQGSRAPIQNLRFCKWVRFLYMKATGAQGDALRVNSE